MIWIVGVIMTMIMMSTIQQILQRKRQHLQLLALTINNQHQLVQQVKGDKLAAFYRHLYVTDDLDLIDLDRFK